MGTVRILLGIICLNLVFSNGVFKRNMLSKSVDPVRTEQNREALVKIAEGEIGVRELTGHNDGKRIGIYQKYAGIHPGDAYCAAYISWVFGQAGYVRPRSGWCPDLFPATRLAKCALPGDILGIYFPDLKRIAHVGLVVGQRGHWVESCEANTNVAGSREGDGVYRKVRHIRTISKIADWVAERSVTR